MASTLCAAALLSLQWRCTAAASAGPIGDPVPPIALARADGSPEPFDLQQLIGQPALIIFWRPNQDLSLSALRDVEALHQELDPFKVVAVDTSRASGPQVMAVLGDESFSFPFLLDRNRELYGTLGVIVSPTTFILDENGITRFKVASHPKQYAMVVRARLRYLAGEITEDEMKRNVEPAVLKIDHDLAAGLRMYNLAKRLQAEGKIQDAVAEFEKAVAQYPSLSEARCALGFMALETGDYQTAAAHFQTAVNYQPGLAQARLGQACILARTGEMEQAERILLALMGHNSVAVRVRYELGRIYRARGMEPEAATYFADALALVFPEHPRTPGVTTVSPIVAPAAPVDDPRQAAEAEANGPNADPQDNSGNAATPAAVEIEAITPPADAKYIGVKGCKKCHFQQWKSWSETEMAGTFAVLKAGAAVDYKSRHSLNPAKDYTTDLQCLSCHVTGFGHPGGYAIPPAGDARAARAAAQNEGVTCESCHGPGNKYEKIHKEIQDTERQYTQQELYALGEYEVDVRVCAVCHDGGRAPCIEDGYVFDFAVRKDQGTHAHFDLKFRANK